MHKLLEQQFREQGLMRDTDDPARVADEDYLPVPGEDESEMPFTDRLLTDKAIWLDHCGDAVFTKDEFALEVQGATREIRELMEFAGDITLSKAFEVFGKRIFTEILTYAESIENES